jgi:hypothetical protein
MNLKTVKTAELIGPALDWAVAKAIDLEDETLDPLTWVETAHPSGCYSFSTDWSQGGPLIDKIGGFELKVWLESTPETKCEAHIHSYEGNWIVFGPTPLIAAMRCLVAAKLGDTVQVPKELLP